MTCPILAANLCSPYYSFSAWAHRHRAENLHLPKRLSPCTHTSNIKVSAMTTSTPYRSKLSGSTKFRVVHIAAGHWHDPIQCRLIHRKLGPTSRKYPYKALSYVWGSPSVTDTITLEGISFQITLNLSCALRHLRKVDKGTLLWVDALVGVPFKL